MATQSVKHGHPADPVMRACNIVTMAHKRARRAADKLMAQPDLTDESRSLMDRLIRQIDLAEDANDAAFTRTIGLFLAAKPSAIGAAS